MRRADGQATVELVAMIPFLVAVGLAVFTVLAAGRASARAEAAAEAGAVALLRGVDAAAAARRAAGEGAQVRVRGGRVRVTVRPLVPLFADRLTAVAEADAGRVRPAAPDLTLLRGGDGAGSGPRR